MAFAGRPVETDLGPAGWLARSVRPLTDHVVASLVPEVFPAYARVFHPATHYVGDDDVDVRWAEVAAANGTVAHPVMEWASITGSMDYFDEADQSPLWEGAPARGHLPSHVAGRMAAVLRRHTRTPEDCFLGVCADFGFLPAGTPTGVVSARRYAFLRGPVELASENMAEEPWEQSASLWWPADRAWFVATDIDLVTTYVGGSAACIADLLAEPGLETAAASPDQGVTWDADQINPWPEDAPQPRP